MPGPGALPGTPTIYIPEREAARATSYRTEELSRWKRPAGDVIRFNHGRVDSPTHAKERPDDKLQSRPKPDRVQNGIEDIRDYAVVTLFWAGVMVCVMARRLHKAKSLQECDDRVILSGRTVCPLVNLVCVPSESGEQPYMPGQHPTQPRSQNDRRSNEQ